MSERLNPGPQVADEALEQRQQVERNLEFSHRAAVVGGGLGMVANFATGYLVGAAILLAGIVVMGLSWVMLRAGRMKLSALVYQITLVSTIHTLCATGQGLRDTAMVLYPLAILTAALVLDRGLLTAVTAGCIASVVILVPQGDPNDWAIVLDMAIILVVSAVAVDLLLRGVLQKAAEARTKERRLAEAYTELERFTRVVSHDLKSPLVTIRGFLEYVKEDALSGDRDRLEKDVQRIRIATERMGHLLDDLLELSRTGRISRPHEDLIFGDVVQEARAVVSGRLGTSGLQVAVAPEAAACTVRGDKARLVQLVQNLLDNAAKFTGEQAQPHVHIGLREDAGGEGRVFTVRDNGLGIDPAHRERIFDLFHKLDPGGDGTGLGLALARRIVETHGGRIWAESEGRGRGATFCFTLPPGRGGG